MLQPDTERDARLRRLAKGIQALAAKDEANHQRSQEIADLRCRAAADLHAVCSNFVRAVNRLLPAPEVRIDPPEFQKEQFHDEAPNLIQISVRGRILQVEFETTPELLSTEDFRIPYTLSGAVRAFNQAMLDKDLIEEQLIYYTVEKDKTMWRFFDPRTYRSGSLVQEYLTGVMEQLL